MNTVYFGWQLNLKDTEQSISDALKRYFDKFGFPPEIMLVSDRLEAVKLHEGMQIVVKTNRMPKNILLLGNDTESTNGRSN